MRFLLLVSALVSVLSPAAVLANPLPAFQIEDDDIVAFVGGTHFVRAQKLPYLEAALTRAFIAKKPQFRDMSWEGDTVFKQSTVHERWRKGAFGDWPKQLERVGATIVFAQFGQFESLDGEDGVERFVKSYEGLIDAWQKRAKRVVLVSPTPFERADPLLPDLSRRNKDVELFAGSVRELAQRRELLFVDVYAPLLELARAGTRLTTDGTQLTEAAHGVVAATIAKSLGVERNDDPVLRDAIAEKNRLWYDYWRPANWKCLYGDDGNRIFGKAAGDSPSFRDEWKQFPKLIEEAEERVWKIVDRDSVEAQLSSFQIDDGFEVNLFASEAMGVVNPIAIRWDPRGRLWVACTIVYPQIKPGAKPNDYVIILEDVDQDGVADRSTRFAEGLNIPTGMELGEGGLYIGQGTELVHLRDTDGDDRADERRVVLSGFGNGDSHQTNNSFVWSPGGELFSCQGDGIESRVETPWGISSLFQAGVWRLRPKTLQLHGLLDDFMGPGNPWGVAFDDWGQSLVIDGAGGVSFLSPAQLPSKHKLRLPRIGRPGGYCGIDGVGSVHMPEHYQGDFLIGDYHKNTVSRFAIREAGSGYSVQWKKPILRSSHKNFRPIDIRQGPDGAMYIADWYNLVICHQDASYRHPGRDRTHGRIWRVSVKGGTKVARRKLSGTDLATTVDALRSPERWERYQAKRVLADADRDAAAKALRDWVVMLDPKASGYEHALFEALGAFETIEVVDRETLERLLGAKDHRARAYAARTVGRWSARLDAPLELLARSIQDEHPLVRMEALVACSAVGDPHAIEVVAMAVDRPMDRFVEYSFTQAVHHLAPHWRPALERGQLSFGANSRRLAAVLRHVGGNRLVESIRSLAKSEEIDAEARRGLLRTLVSVGEPKDLALALARSTYGEGAKYDAVTHAKVLGDLAEVGEQRDTRPAGDPAPVLRELVRGEGSTRNAAIRLTGVWSVQQLTDDIVEIARSGEVDTATRAESIRALSRFGGDDARSVLEKLAGAGGDVSVRTAAIVGLCGVDVEAASKHAVRILADEDVRDLDFEAILEAFLGRKDGAGRLAAALGKSEVSPDVGELGLRVLGSSGRLATPLAEVFREAGGARGASREYSPGLVIELTRAVLDRGDAARGELVFRSAKANCHSCHMIGGAGGWIGPDLGSVGTTLPIDRVIEEVLWPSRHVKEGYTAHLVVTNRGTVHQGYEEKTRDKSTLLLREFQSGSTLRFGKESIVSRTEVGSTMPDDVTGRLSEKEQLDLLRFLTQLGRPGPFATSHLPLIRTWEVLDSDGRPSTVFSRVSGALHWADLMTESGSSVQVRTRVGVTHAGEILLLIGDARGLEIRWNDEKIAASKTISITATEGEHLLSISVDREARQNAPLRAFWVDSPSAEKGRVRQGPVQIPR